MATWKYNKGEWTEAYVFLRLLGEGRIYGASSELTKDPTTYIDILKIIRDEPDKIVIFERFINDNIDKVKVSKDGEVIKIVVAPELSEYAESVYEKIKNIRTSECIPDVQKYLENICFDSPKANLSESAKEKYGAKTDIIITSRNSIDHSTSTEGFSIKSHLGSPATLFNCSQTSGFTYEITNCNTSLMHKINAADSFLAMINAIKSLGLNIVFHGCRNDIFEQNICIVDSQMDKVLSEAVQIHAGCFDNSSQSSRVKDICEYVIQRNPVGVRNPQMFYPAKFKDFLFASFAGLTASSIWNGRKRITGGYIDVSGTGEMLYYRAISDDIFGNYLFENTYFDRPDRGMRKELAYEEAIAFEDGRSLTEEERNNIIYQDGKSGPMKSKKGDFGYVYEKNGKFFIDINFQIRFK